METEEGREDPAPHFRDPGMSSSSSHGGFPCKLQVPAAAGLHHYASEGPLTPRAAGSCSSLRQRAEVALRPLVDMAPKFAISEAQGTLPNVIPKPFHLLTI